MFDNFFIVYDYDNHKTVIKTKDGYTTNDIEKIVVTILSGDETGTIYYKDGTEQKFDAFTHPLGRYHSYFDGMYTVEDIPLWLNFEPEEGKPFDTFAYQRQRYYLEEYVIPVITSTIPLIKRQREKIAEKIS